MDARTGRLIRTLARADRLYWDTLALARDRAGDWRGALDALRTADARPGNHAGFQAERDFLRARAHWRLGEADEARKAFDAGERWMAQNRGKAATEPTTWRDAVAAHEEAERLLVREKAPAPRAAVWDDGPGCPAPNA